MIGATQRTAVRRWKLGHHAFHLYLIAMNTELPIALRLTEQRRWDALLPSLQRLTVLYDAATASMKFAADFDPDEYDTLIRPSMAPPFLSPGFSGQQNRDHATMLDLMSEAQRTLKALLRNLDVPAGLRAAATALWEAQARNRRHHILVCAKFVPDGGSLLKDYLEGKTR
ncbi:hypothetical protein [Virgisporangium aurantiacum]|uniref:Uncharacterized protein n=1 Tax=Virgisporangium aurantiacum TaxID=175570 RepID=A0A8J4E0J8_9ACTN|nr:hypothetical protein [Virgisporangium aurantiacum]GIJ57790.1 hypothetical protein Vau01_053060 [Virgisporangium aurantiacum]